MEIGAFQILFGETWLPIKGFPNYLVSNKGRVKSIDHQRHDKPIMRKGVILKPRKGREGYLYVELCHLGKATTKYVHRLVAEAFLPNEGNLPCVNHKDECSTNNFVENLEWCTHAYNVNYGTSRNRCRLAHLTSGWAKRVKQYDVLGRFIREFESVSEAARSIGRTPAGISNCCLGNRKIAYGYIWKYS